MGGCLLCTWGGEEMWPFAQRAGGRASLTRLRGAERSMAAKAAPPPARRVRERLPLLDLLL